MNATTAIARLERMLDEKDAEIERLTEQIHDAEERAAADTRWTKHVDYEAESAPHPSLPVPRLQIEWREMDTPSDGYAVEAVYSLVYRHLLGYIVCVPLGHTRSTGALAKRVHGDSVDLPFRDGAHFANEMRQLKLRGFGVVGEHVHEYRFCSHCGRLDYAHRGGAMDGRCDMPPLDEAGGDGKEGACGCNPGPPIECYAHRPDTKGLAVNVACNCACHRVRKGGAPAPGARGEGGAP